MRACREYMCCVHELLLCATQDDVLHVNKYKEHLHTPNIMFTFDSQSSCPSSNTMISLATLTLHEYLEILKTIGKTINYNFIVIDFNVDFSITSDCRDLLLLLFFY